MLARCCLLMLLALLPPLAVAKQTLTLAIDAIRPKPIMEQKYRSFEVYLSGALPGHRIKIEFLNKVELEEALAAGRLDFVFANPGYFVQLRHKNLLSGAIATLQTYEAGQVASALGGVMIARSDRADLNRLADLPGKRIATPGAKFFGAYQTQAYEFLQAGIDFPAAVELVLVDNLDRVIEAVLSGSADVGFVRTGLLEAMEREGKLPAGQLKVINRQSHPGFPFAASTRLYPEWPLVAVSHVPEDVLKRIARALLFITPDLPMAQDAGIAGFTIPADYQSVEQLTRSLRLPPFEKAEFEARDVWQRYRWFILAGIGAAGLILFLLIQLLAGNRSLRQQSIRLRESEQQLALTIEGADLGTWDWQIPSGELRYNPRWGDLLDLADGERIADRETWLEHVHPADRASQKAALDRHLAGESPAYSCGFRLLGKSGNWRWVHDTGRVLERDAQGRPLRVVGILQDITEAKEAEVALRQREQHMQSLIAAMDDIVMVIDTAGCVDTCYWPASDPQAPDVAAWRGQECTRLLPEAYASEIVAIMGHLIVNAERPRRLEIEWSLGGGSRWFSVILSALKNPDDFHARGFLLVARDISVRKAMEVELMKLATTDALTGAANRRHFLAIAEAELARVQRFERPAALLMLDLDFFKQVNDTHGHAAGDAVLKTFAATVRDSLRKVDRMVRLGGEEFGVLLPGNGANEARLYAERLRGLVAASKTNFEQIEIVVTVSIGIAVMQAGDDDAEVALARADAALYRAKLLGRNRVEIEG